LKKIYQKYEAMQLSWYLRVSAKKLS